MRVNFTFRNMDSSDGIRAYATDKVARLQKFVRSPLDVEVTVSVERHLHCVDLSVAADGHRFGAREESEDMYASIDLALDKIDRQIRDAKAMMTTRKRHGHAPAVDGSDS